METQPTGNLCEIGVHHGRYFIGLALALKKGEKALAVDLFSRQDENIDGSGKGNKDIFLHHVKTFLPDPSIVDAIEANSLEVTPDRILKYGPIRFFSVDGGHNSRAVVNDLHLAESSISTEGIVSLDDILNPHWTGVITGYVAYRDSGGTLCPFALIPGKLLLCREDQAMHYRALLLDRCKASCERLNVEFFGAYVDVYGLT